MQVNQQQFGQVKYEGLLRSKRPTSFLLHIKEVNSDSFLVLQCIIFQRSCLFSQEWLVHLHQGQHLKYTLDNICPVGQKRMKHFTVTLNTLTESPQVFFLKQDQILANIID